MKIKKILIIACAFIMCSLSVVPAFAVEDIETVSNSEITEVSSEAFSDVQSDDVTEAVSEPAEEEVYGEVSETISETEAETDNETKIFYDKPETTKSVEKQNSNENRVTIYFKDIAISFTLKLKNKDTGKTVEMTLNKDNNWIYSGVIEPGVYEISSAKPKSSQFKIKSICNNEGKEIKEIKIDKTGEGIQSITLYPKTKVITGLLSFFKKNIFLDICIVLVVVLYIINAKGYRIPILSNWIDNYRNN